MYRSVGVGSGVVAGVVGSVVGVCDFFKNG
jgi:hypothetical protein